MKADFNKATTEEIAILCNGCGPQNAGWARPFIPQFVFMQAGDRHDWDYWVGGGLTDYVRANMRFYAGCLMAIADESPIHKWPWHLLMAHLYYVLVKFGGGLSFRWGRPRTHEEMKSLALHLMKGKMT